MRVRVKIGICGLHYHPSNPFLFSVIPILFLKFSIFLLHWYDCKFTCIVTQCFQAPLEVKPRNLKVPTTQVEKFFVQLVEILTKHYEPKSLIIAERFAFHKCSQHHQKSVKDFVAELRCRTIHCAFGIT